MEAPSLSRAIYAAARTALAAATCSYASALASIGTFIARMYRVTEIGPADDRDMWYRQLTRTDCFRHGRVHHATFKGGRAVSDRVADPHAGRAETSGRLLSRSGNAADITAHGKQQANARRERATRPPGRPPSDIVYVGVAAAFVEDVRSWEQLRADVLWEWTNEDSAHSNLVFLDLNSREFTMDQMSWLARNLTPVPADRIHDLHAKFAQRRLGLRESSRAERQ
jgi:hypothetical protein